MVSHYTYAIGVLPLHMSFTEKIKLTTGLCKAGYNRRHQGQDYIQSARKKKKKENKKTKQKKTQKKKKKKKVVERIPLEMEKVMLAV